MTEERENCGHEEALQSRSDTRKDFIGISLRDFFAAYALQALVEKTDFPYDTADKSWDTDVAKRAYSFADAMLAVRKIDS